MDNTTSALRRSSNDRMIRAAVLVGVSVIFVIGALQLALITDDAYITFRYVANAHDGLGLVWNQAPFRPVEGYSSFLWAASLWAALSWFGVEPPDSATPISILFGLGLLAVVAFTAFRIQDRDGKRLSHLAVLCTLAAIVSNRTFLQWTTGGLGTSLFGLCFVSWVVMAFRAQERRTTKWLMAWATLAALAALARPDGLLFVAATVGATGWAVAAKDLKLRTALLALTPLLAVAAHLLWHRWFYGEFLPNTYYAKVSTPWPEAGVRYFACFCFENAGWLWAPLAFVWVLVEIARQRLACWRQLLSNIPAVAVITATLGHTAYYTPTSRLWSRRCVQTSTASRCTVRCE
jgi:arabinofuranosyltransferase